jgi:hypothetical protein
MTLLRGILTELWGLFVDDGNLAAQALALILLVAALVKLAGVAPLAAGGLLLLGCLAILALSLWRRARK